MRLPRKAFVLAAFMLLDPPKGSMTRERAARLLWEEADVSRRSGNLRQLLARVKDVQTEEGFELFVIGSDHLALDLDAVEIDVQSVLQARADTTDRRLFELCRAYGGDLLAGLEEDGEEFSRWLWSRRALVREQFVAVVSANVETAMNVLDGQEAMFVARRLVEADPYQEAGHRAQMRILAARGDFEGVFRVHRRLLEALRESGGRPSNETMDLVADLSSRARSKSQSRGEAETPASGGTTESAPMPMLGRGLQLPRLSIAFPGLADLQGSEREWADALLDDAAIQLWRTRSFVLRRGADLRARPIDLGEKVRREPSDYTVDCRILPRDGRRVLTIGLIAVASGEILWIQRYDLGEPIARTAREVVVNCIHHIEQAELRALAAGPEATTAYRLTLQGSRLLRSIDLPSIRRARQVFRAALAVDPEHAPTLAAISKAYRLEWLRLARADDKELDLAIDFARQAIAAGPESPHGLHQFGICNIYKKSYERGLAALDRAEKHFPYQLDVVAEHADGLICYGSTAKGLEKIAPILEDGVTVNDQVLWNAASGYYLSGDYRTTLELLSRMSTEEPAYHLKAACHALLDQTEEARRYVRKLREILPDFTISKRLAMVPLRRREDLEHYEFGLRTAGFE